MLTKREAEVAQLVARGVSYRAVGRALGIAERTVQTHVANAAAKIEGSAPPKTRLLIFVTLSETD